MRSKKKIIGDQKGVATTEFVIVSFLFVVIFAAFIMISDTVLFKMKSLISARTIAFNQTDEADLPQASFKREIFYAGQTHSSMLDNCLLVYFATRPSRIKVRVDLAVPSFFNEFISPPNISDQYQIDRDTWKGLSPVAMRSLMAGCSG